MLVMRREIASQLHAADVYLNQPDQGPCYGLVSYQAAAASLSEDQVRLLSMLDNRDAVTLHCSQHSDLLKAPATGLTHGQGVAYVEFMELVDAHNEES